MDYNEAMEFIHSSYKFGCKHGLENISELLRLMGEPHKRYPIIHVAGTNGKGSVVAFTASVLQTAGYVTGKYISPFIERFSERISINGEEINNEDLAEIVALIKKKTAVMLAAGFRHPTEFEIVTALAFEYFARKDCEIIVLEVGLGGRFDATNVIEDTLLAVITPISCDHTAVLGGSPEKIAYEKAGIIKKGCSVVSAVQNDEVLAVLCDKCRQEDADLTVVDDLSGDCGINVEYHPFTGSVIKIRYPHRENTELSIKVPLLGKHQAANAMCAYTAICKLHEKGYKISPSLIAKGFAAASWPGRLERLRENPCLMIDGAHNTHAAGVLKDYLSEIDMPVYMITGIMADKDIDGMLKIVAPYAVKMFTVTADEKRGINSVELAEKARQYCADVVPCDTINEAVEQALVEVPENGLVLAWGSLYYIGKIREQQLACR